MTTLTACEQKHNTLFYGDSNTYNIQHTTENSLKKKIEEKKKEKF